MDGMNFMSINCHSDSLFDGTDIQQIPTTLYMGCGVGVMTVRGKMRRAKNRTVLSGNSQSTKAGPGPDKYPHN